MNKCSIQDCEKQAKFRNLCGMHYKRWWRHGNTEKVLRVKAYNGQSCSIADCSKIAKENGLCINHAQLKRVYGRTHTIIAKRGEGRPKTQGGYVLVTRDGKRNYEHIFLAEQALGKPLPKDAIVHHADTNRGNNTNTNLVICPNQEYHLLLHRRLILFQQAASSMCNFLQELKL